MAQSKEEMAAYSKAYYESNKERILSQKKAYYKANKEKKDAYREANKDKKAAYDKSYQEANKEKIAAYREANKEKRAAYMKAYIEANKEKLSAYREANKEKLSAYNKDWREVNKKSYNASKKAYNSERRKTDSLYRLTRDIRTLICNSFKNKGYSKNTKTANILGCSFEELQSHLGEKTSNDHTDHIIPLTWGNTEEEIYTLNHYSNLQILTAEENIAKGNRFTRLDNVKKVLALHPYPERVQEILDRNQDKIVA